MTFCRKVASRPSRLRAPVGVHMAEPPRGGMRLARGAVLHPRGRLARSRENDRAAGAAAVPTTAAKLSVFVLAAIIDRLQGVSLG